jgi:long-chain acyl-CoA synthetase
MLVNEFLENSAKLYPDKTALVCQNKRVSYSEIDEMANKLANALIEKGLKRQDRVAIYLDNSIETVVSIFGILKADAVFVVLNQTTKTDKLEFILNNCRVKGLVAHSKNKDNIAPILPHIPSLETVILTNGENPKGKFLSYEKILSSYSNKKPQNKNIDIDLAALIYTSGSTGKPKGVMLTHLNIVSAASSIIQYLENRPDDIILDVLPLSFDYGLYQVLMTFKFGGTIVLEKSFLYPYQVIDLMIKEKVTGFPGVPTIFAILLQLEGLKNHQFEHLRYITNTAAALPVSFIEKIRETFPQAKLYSMYGLTECKRVSYLPPEELDRRPNSVGKGMPNQEVYLVDEKGEKVKSGVVGELVVRGSNVMKGYWELPEETAKVLKPGKYPGEMVLYTGDWFKMDEEGFLYFVARKDDIIKCRGEKVSPKEIENILYQMEGVLEVSVIGVPDDVLGEAIKALIVLKKGSNLTQEEILRHCAGHLEDFMVPQYVEFRESLPKTESGKIKKEKAVK